MANVREEHGSHAAMVKIVSGSDMKVALAALKMGGERQQMALVGRIRLGFAMRFVSDLSRHTGFPQKTLIEMGIAPRHVSSQSANASHLSKGRSERGMRLLRVFHDAEGTFGSRERAMLWLERPTRPLQMAAPIALLDTEEGARLVSNLILRINCGLAS